jgi:preprotein translocase subunit Sec61beta
MPAYHIAGLVSETMLDVSISILPRAKQYPLLCYPSSRQGASLGGGACSSRRSGEPGTRCGDHDTRAGLVRFKENEESKFLGPSSGIAITRLVMEMAKQNTDTKASRKSYQIPKLNRSRTASRKRALKQYRKSTLTSVPWLRRTYRPRT